MQNSNRSAFTLVELSIVLVVIGLIVGGILVGRDLILAAQVRMQIAQIESLDSAVNTFKLKYGAIPGDINNASSLGLGTAGDPGRDGNGNGVLDFVIPATGNSVEAHRFWHHLSRSGLIDGRYDQPLGFDPYFGPIPGKQTPSLKFPMMAEDSFGTPANRNNLGGIVVAYPLMYKNYVNSTFSHAWFLTTSSNDAESIAGYSGFHARMIDQKIDEGYPATGSVVSVENVSSGMCSGGNCFMQLGIGPTTSSSLDINACVNDGVTPWQYTNTLIVVVSSCALLIRAKF